MDFPGIGPNGDGGGGDDLLNEPLYASSDVAHLLHVHPDTLRYWVRGKTYPVAGGKTKTAEPLVGNGSGLLSFQDLAELAVVAHLRHLGFQVAALRHVAEGIKAATASSRPFLDQLHRILTGGATEIALEVERGAPISMTHPGQRLLPLPVDEVFKRLEVVRGSVVVRVRPFSRPEDPLRDPALIEIDPRRRFGRPITRPNGLDVAAIHDRRRWGESIDELMEDLHAGREEIEEALRYHELYLRAA
jgi:uncharacterized protein (DUF433 family)/DNA-binding transcriptional MerR regulator